MRGFMNCRTSVRAGLGSSCQIADEPCTRTRVPGALNVRIGRRDAETLTCHDRRKASRAGTSSTLLTQSGANQKRDKQIRPTRWIGTNDSFGELPVDAADTRPQDGNPHARAGNGNGDRPTGSHSRQVPCWVGCRLPIDCSDGGNCRSALPDPGDRRTRGC